MNDLPLKVEKITGTASENTACGIFTNRITLTDGTIALITNAVLAQDGKNNDLQTLLKDIFELLSKKIESASLDDGVLEAVRFATEATLDYLKPKDIKVSFVIAVFYKDTVYISRYGEKLKILVFEPPRQTEITFDIGSGPVVSGQIVLVATEKFLEKFDVDVFKKTAEIDFSEIIDGLATEISGEKDQSEIGAAFILAKGETQSETEKIIEPSGEKGKEDTETSYKEETEVLDSQYLQEDQDDILKKKTSGKFEKLTFLIASFFNVLFSEFKKLRRGDIKAIFRLRRNIVLVIGIIAVILVISVGLTVRQKIQKGKLAEFNSHLSSASAKYDEAQAIGELNRTKARGFLAEADKEIKLALAIQKNDQKAQDLANEIANKLKETEESANVNFSKLFDAPAQINSLSFSGKSLTVFAGDKILVGNSADELSTIAGVADAQSGVVFANSAFILTGSKVHKLDLKTEKKEELFEFEAGDIAVFLGNVYLPSGDQIAKFVPVEGGYSRSGDYLEDKTELLPSSRLSIDGSIWVTAGSKVANFLRGKNQNFEISGLSGQIGQLESIYTTSSMDNIYVVDKTNSALLVVSKEGVYNKAYQSPEFARGTDVVISDDEATMYISVGNKVLEARL